jgi:hypothetical protein
MKNEKRAAKLSLNRETVKALKAQTGVRTGYGVSQHSCGTAWYTCSWPGQSEVCLTHHKGN